MARQIVGISLLRNEELFAGWALRNALHLCDRIIAIDNNSTDATPRILADLAASDPRIEVRRDGNAVGTNIHVQPFIGEDVWIMGVDGDEIFDRAGLRRMRQDVLGGRFDRYWRVYGHTLSATWIDLQNGHAEGYATPASKAAAKLYNFGAISSWHSETQRLHGVPKLRAGYARADRIFLAEVQKWDEADFRSLHLCFFPRSETDGASTIRLNITDTSLRNRWRRRATEMLEEAGWTGNLVYEYLNSRSVPRKLRQYVRGSETPVKLSGFGRPTANMMLSEPGEASERIIREISVARLEGRLPRIPSI